jgi:transcriptional regulator with XRE-family HTH domain
MEQLKYNLTPTIKNELRFLRQKRHLAAEDVSIELGKSKAWLGQIERGKLLSIKKDDLIKLLLIYTNFTEHEIVYEGVLENFLEFGKALPHTLKSDSIYVKMGFESTFDIFMNNFNSENEREIILEYFEKFLYLMQHYPGVTSSFFRMIPKLLYMIENYSTLSKDKFFSKTSTLMNRIEKIILEEHENASKTS